MTDLDQGGAGYHRANVYRGPSLGWSDTQLVPSRKVGSGTTDIMSGDTVILVDTTGAAVLNLPDVRLWWNEFFYRPVAGFSRELVIKNFVGASSITIHPFGTQTIDKTVGDRLITNAFDSITLCPLVDLSGWFVVEATDFGGGTGLFIQTGTGAVTRTMLDKAREQVSVTDFGVVINNVGAAAANTVALNQAIQSAAGRTLTFPSGTTTFIDGPLVLANGSTLGTDGWHSATVKTTSATANIFTLTLPAGKINASNICIDNLVIDSTVLKTAGWGILVHTIDGGAMFFSKFSNLFFGSNLWSGIGIEQCLDIVIQNVVVNGVGEGGFGMKFGGLGLPANPPDQGVAGIWLDNIILNNARALPVLNYGIQFSDAAEGVYGSRISIEGPHWQNHLYFANPSGDISVAPRNMWFDKVICDVPRFIGIAVENGVALRFTDCWTTSGDNAAGGGIFVAGGTDIEIKGHTAIANAGYGIHLGALCKQVRILGGMIANNSVGVTVDANTTDFMICDVRFGRSGAAVTHTFDVAIAGGTSDRYVVANNSMFGTTTGAIFDGGSGTNKIIGPNIAGNGATGTSFAIPTSLNNDTLIGASTAAPGSGNTGTGVALRPVGVIYASAAAQTALHVNVNVDGNASVWYRSGVVVAAVQVTATTGIFANLSDGRLKEDFRTFDAGSIIDRTEVYDFAWKSTGERSYGVAAQQAQEVLPQAVAHDAEHDWWGIDYSKYVPIVLQELKSLRARLAKLEGGGQDA